MGIKGFPTLKTVRVTGSRGKPIIQDYNGPRTAAGIVEAVKGLIPNVVQKVTDDKLESFFSENNSTAKALLFSDKGSTAALVKVLANEYATNMNFAQIRDKEEAANKMFGVTSYPTIVVLPGGSKDPVVYDGKVEKKALNEFFSQYASIYEPPKEEKKEKGSKTDKKSALSDSSTFAEASASDKSSKASEAAASATAETLEDDNLTESPKPIVDEEAPTPIPVPDAVPLIDILDTYEQVQKHCLGPKTQTCVLAFLPGTIDEESEQPEPNKDALVSLAKIARKHKERGDHLFPFYAVPDANPGFAALKTAIGFNDDGVQLLAINGKRSWYKQYDGEKGYGIDGVEGWIDGIRFGEGKKEKLPEGLVVEVPTTEQPAADETVAAEETVAEDEEKPKGKHDEL